MPKNTAVRNKWARGVTPEMSDILLPEEHADDEPQRGTEGLSEYRRQFRREVSRPAKQKPNRGTGTEMASDANLTTSQGGW